MALENMTHDGFMKKILMLRESLNLGKGLGTQIKKHTKKKIQE